MWPQVGTGFSDEVLQSHTKFFKEKELVRETKPMNVQVGNVQTPDVWLEPGTVRVLTHHRHSWCRCTLTLCGAAHVASGVGSQGRGSVHLASVPCCVRNGACNSKVPTCPRTRAWLAC